MNLLIYLTPECPMTPRTKYDKQVENDNVRNDKKPQNMTNNTNTRIARMSDIPSDSDD
jgi:hypothetical protein